jgi:hypothetical protein
MINNKEPPDEEDMLHYPEGEGKLSTVFLWRSFLNVGVLLVVIP